MFWKEDCRLANASAYRWGKFGSTAVLFPEHTRAKSIVYTTKLTEYEQ
jgi:hypothetical protein